MKQFIYILLIPLLCFTACQSEEVASQNAKGTLCLTLQRGPKPLVSTRAVAEGLVVMLIAPDGTVYQEFSAGEIPTKIILSSTIFPSIVTVWVALSNTIPSTSILQTRPPGRRPMMAKARHATGARLALPWARTRPSTLPMPFP